MSLVGFKGQNHPQQVGVRGADDNVDDRGTDPHIFWLLDKEYRFTLDVAASAENAKCEDYYDKEADGLRQPWSGTVWCNPPYSNIRPWVEKAWLEWEKCATIVMLLPANRTEQKWWQELVEPYRDRPGGPLRVKFMSGRMRFVKANQDRIGANERPPFGCCLLEWEAPDRWCPTVQNIQQGRLGEGE